MSKEEKLIPELRFPEFINDGKWVKKSIGSLTKVTTGGTPTSTEPKYWGGNIPWMNSGELNLKRVYSVENKITELGLKESATKKIPPLCVLIGLAGQGKTRGTAAINYIKLCTNQSIGAIHPNEIKFNSEFLFQRIDSMYQALRSLSTGQGGRGGLNLSIIREIEIPFPSIKEQQKIAHCLSSLDELIAAHNDKLEALKDHKKGLLQNLFPDPSASSGGETVPKVRFPEFEGDGDWVEKKLGDAADFINGRAYKKEELLTSGKYRVLRVGNFFTNNEWYYSDLELDDDKYCDKGDLLYAWSASFGPRIWDKEKVIYHYHIWKVVEKKEIDKQFLFVLLDFETEKIKAAQARGLGMQHLTKSGIEEWETSIPPTKNEQKKIASSLLAVDDLIIAQQDKIEQLQQHKKGLMQGLFPKI